MVCSTCTQRCVQAELFMMVVLGIALGWLLFHSDETGHSSKSKSAPLLPKEAKIDLCCA
jgi:hypothetical protein